LFEDKDDSKKASLKKYILNILDSNILLFIMAFLTSFVLFGSDVKSISLDPDYDHIFNGIFLLVLILFIIEFAANWYVRPGYIKTFFFWLDLLSILSMFLEIEWILVPILDSLIL
jgi:hypothetical protein